MELKNKRTTSPKGGKDWVLVKFQHLIDVSVKKERHFDVIISSIGDGGTRTFLPIWGYQDIFTNLGVPGHFCNIMVSLCKYTPMKSTSR